MGVNTFLSAKGSPIERPGEVIRAGEDEKQMQLDSLEVNIQVSHSKTDIWLDKIQQAAINQENIFAVLMEASKYASLGQITHALFDVGGRYRRNM